MPAPARGNQHKYLIPATIHILQSTIHISVDKLSIHVFIIPVQNYYIRDEDIDGKY